MSRPGRARQSCAVAVGVALVVALAGCSASGGQPSPSPSPTPDLADRFAAAVFAATNDLGGTDAQWVASPEDVAVAAPDWAGEDDVALTARATLSAAFLELVGDSWDVSSQGDPVLEVTLEEIAEPQALPLCGEPAHSTAEPARVCHIEGVAGTDRIVHRKVSDDCQASVLVTDEFTLTVTQHVLDDDGCAPVWIGADGGRAMLETMMGDLFPDHDWEADVVGRQHYFGRAGRFTVPANWDAAINTVGDALRATDPAGNNDNQTLFINGDQSGTAERDEHNECEVMAERRAPATATQPARVVQVMHWKTAWMVGKDTVEIGLSDDRGGSGCEGPYGVAVGDSWTTMEVSWQYAVEDLPQLDEWLAGERFEALAQEMLSVEIVPAD